LKKHENHNFLEVKSLKQNKYICFAVSNRSMEITVSIEAEGLMTAQKIVV
jgi:hypothetical protein